MSDDQIEDALRTALSQELGRIPPPNRVAAVRAHAISAAALAAAANGSASAPRRLRPDQSTPRRTVLIGGIAASVGAALGVGGALLAGAGRDDGGGAEGPPTEAIEFASRLPGVKSDASLINHTWGTELVLDIEGLPAGREFQVAYLREVGNPVLAGSFLSVADTLMKCRFNASLLRADATGVVITSDEQEALRANLS